MRGVGPRGAEAWMKGGSEWAVPTEGGPRKISRGKVTSSGPQCTIRYHPGLPAGLTAYGS